MDIIVKAQPKSTKEMVKSSLMCNLQVADLDAANKAANIDQLLEQDDKALFYINYSSLIDSANKQEKNMHTAMN